MVVELVSILIELRGVQIATLCCNVLEYGRLRVVRVMTAAGLPAGSRSRPASCPCRLAAPAGSRPLPARGHARLAATPGSRPRPASCPCRLAKYAIFWANLPYFRNSRK
jgi:hypothetical protein